MPIRRAGEPGPHEPDRDVDVAPDAGDEQAASFERLVELALDSLPERFQRLLADVAVVIEDLPTRDQLGLAGGSDGGGGGGSGGGGNAGVGWLYGLYEGVPGIEWGADMAPFPNKITLFQVPLETDFRDPENLAEEVRRTVIHELAHHAGISDERLRELDYD